ncbi:MULTISPECIES: non-canonical purine NTP diphosphatase [unclassified Lentimicrobium]|uniref:non-canonical purine NTP diphosphatase n=1 Tax=unclassified Lentimicrobium TaxID=2677434 RepID=UPI0015522C74|nr:MULTISPECIES: non-canonical purine NTP diphosphatase [unclassified Lentimicrobium]NPD44691.1 non-canonical purine NTP diphosphatase [Lentimicrobium sp. S6]NPD83453.1 non-canonical purine NTP diphosphatase [Lentimicrobium sp. L6]
MSLKRIVFATNNAHKLEEVRHYLKGQYKILSLKDIGFNEDIPEPFETLQENAQTKSRTIFNRFGFDCFADDTGLEVDTLGGAPGVYSARYAGLDCSFQDNVNKLLEELKGKENRNANFRTVISLIIDGQEFFFEGRVDGSITETSSGTDGFGYDPIFAPEGNEFTFAEMSLDDKNKISHRGRAVAKLIQFLQNQ